MYTNSEGPCHKFCFFFLFADMESTASGLATYFYKRCRAKLFLKEFLAFNSTKITFTIFVILAF